MFSCLLFLLKLYKLYCQHFIVIDVGEPCVLFSQWNLNKRIILLENGHNIIKWRTSFANLFWRQRLVFPACIRMFPCTLTTSRHLSPSSFLPGKMLGLKEIKFKPSRSPLAPLYRTFLPLDTKEAHIVRAGVCLHFILTVHCWKLTTLMQQLHHLVA